MSYPDFQRLVLKSTIKSVVNILAVIGFDAKSLVAGVIIGTLGITTVFAATGIQSASLSNMKVTLNGSALPLNKSLISVTMDNEENASLYVPANELLEKLGGTLLPL